MPPGAAQEQNVRRAVHAAAEAVQPTGRGVPGTNQLLQRPPGRLRKRNSVVRSFEEAIGRLQVRRESGVDSGGQVRDGTENGPDSGPVVRRERIAHVGAGVGPGREQGVRVEWAAVGCAWM